MYETSSSQLRSKYNASSSNGAYPRNSDTDYAIDNLELDNIYKKKAIRLELEIAELRKENEQIKHSNQQLKNSEALRNSRMQTLDQEKQISLQHDRDDLMRDVTDLARGNRLLSQENDVLSQKYSNLLDVYNKIILNNTSASKLAEVYSNQIEGRTRVLKDYTKDKWEEFSELSSEYEQNKRKTNELYATLKGKLMHLQTDSHINNDTKQQWRSYAEDVQEVFDQVFRISQEQSDLHQKIILNQSAKNRELQQKIEQLSSVAPRNGAQNQNTIDGEFNQKEVSAIASNLMNNSSVAQNGKRSNGLTSIQESDNQESHPLNNNQVIKKTSSNQQDKEQSQLASSKRPKTASANPSQVKKQAGTTLKKSITNIGESKSRILSPSKTKIPVSPSKTKIPVASSSTKIASSSTKIASSSTKIAASPSKTKLASPSKTNLGATKKPVLSKSSSITSLQGIEGVSKLTKSKIVSPNKTPKMTSSVQPKINVLQVPK